MPQDRIDLSPSSVLHVKGYSSREHPRKNKYVLIIGRSTTVALGFLISSQLAYLHQESHKREVVRIPHRATSFLSVESIIQCFELEVLSVSSLCGGFERGDVTNAGRLPTRYLHKIRAVVQESRLLSQAEIDQILRVLPVTTPQS